MMTLAQRFDDYILILINKRIQNKFLDRLMPIITDMGNLGIVWVVIAAVLILDKPYRSVGNIVLLTLIISTIIGEGIIKHIVRRVRPSIHKSPSCLLIRKPLSYSFPSGHTLSSFAAAKVLSTYFNQYSLVFITIALLIALSRIYLYVHYPTDIIAGAMLGILCSKLVFIILKEGYLEKAVAFYKNLL